MIAFADLPRGAQLVQLRRAALKVLERYGLGASRLRLLDHGYNTTFRVDAADGRRFALRINVNSRRSLANVRAEIEWVAALGRETALHLPHPAIARDGNAVQLVPVDGLAEPRPAVRGSGSRSAATTRLGRAVKSRSAHAGPRGLTCAHGSSVT